MCLTESDFDGQLVLEWTLTSMVKSSCLFNYIAYVYYYMRDTIAVFGHDSALQGIYWAEENLGEWDECCYETCPWCRIDHSTCWPAVHHATTELRMPLYEEYIHVHLLLFIMPLNRMLNMNENILMSDLILEFFSLLVYR